MSSQRPRFRGSILLATGSKVSLIVASLFLVAGAYFLLVPISLTSNDALPFDCRTAINPPTADFPKRACSSATGAYQLRAASIGIAAMLVAGLGVALFGIERSPRVPEDDEVTLPEPAEA